MAHLKKYPLGIVLSINFHSILVEKVVHQLKGLFK